MKKVTLFLCEVIFMDHKSEILTSRIGRIDESQLTNLSTSINNFIIFKESYNSPILKKDIDEIIIHQNDRKISIKKKETIIINHLKSQKIGEIS